MGLLKKLPPRSTRTGDATAVSRASKAVVATPTVKGGKSVYERISTIVAVVNTKLGKYKDKYELLRTAEDVRAYVDDIIKFGYGAIDTETSSLEPITTTIAGVCLYVPGRKACYIPFNHVSYVTGVLSSNQVSMPDMAAELRRAEDAGVKWVFHNAKFDIRVCRNQLGVELSA